MKNRSRSLLLVASFIAAFVWTDMEYSFDVFSGNDTATVAQTPPGERRRVRRRTRRRTRRRVERRMEKQTFHLPDNTRNWYWTA